MMESVVAFGCQALGAPRRDELGIKDIKRTKSAPRGVAFLEVIVQFVDMQARDDILMRGHMLAGYRSTDNKPTAGIRLEIPAHLMGAFKTLEAFGFALKRRHGNQLKKHIKFDDYDESLFIQVGLRKDKQETNWTTYTAGEAREGIKKLSAKKGPRFDYMASPEKEDDASEPSKRKQQEKRSAATAFPWIPPTRSKTGTGTPSTSTGWVPPNREEEAEEME